MNFSSEKACLLLSSKTADYSLFNAICSEDRSAADLLRGVFCLVPRRYSPWNQGNTSEPNLEVWSDYGWPPVRNAPP